MPRRSHKVRLSFLITWACRKVRGRQKNRPAMQQKMRQERFEAWEREGLDPGSLLLR